MSSCLPSIWHLLLTLQHDPINDRFLSHLRTHLMEDNTTSIDPMVMQNQLCRAGHCIRMSVKPSPPIRTFCTTNTWYEKMWWLENDLKTMLNTMKKGQIYITAWELMAADRPLWRRTIYQATAKFETNSLLQGAEKGHRRKKEIINMLTSSFHLAPPAHTTTRSDQ